MKLQFLCVFQMHLLKDIKYNCHHTIFFLPILQYDPFAEHRPQKISDREDEYKKRRQKMIISPERHDPFADGKFYITIFLSVYFICPCRSVFTLLMKFQSKPVLFLVNPSNTTQQLAPWIRLTCKTVSVRHKSFNGMC